MVKKFFDFILYVSGYQKNSSVTNMLIPELNTQFVIPAGNLNIVLEKQ